MTQVTDLYDGFLAKISDYTLLADTRSPEEIEEDLFDYLKSACRIFSRKCKQDLSILTDGVTGEKYFASTLNIMEEDVLIALMLVEYLKPKVVSSEIINQNVNDKDFQTYSQASHLRELSLLYRLFRAEARQLTAEYTLSDIEEWFKK